jgi:hypothetical protein
MTPPGLPQPPSVSLGNVDGDAVLDPGTKEICLDVNRALTGLPAHKGISSRAATWPLSSNGNNFFSGCLWSEVEVGSVDGAHIRQCAVFVAVLRDEGRRPSGYEFGVDVDVGVVEVVVARPVRPTPCRRSVDWHALLAFLNVASCWSTSFGSKIGPLPEKSGSGRS